MDNKILFGLITICITLNLEAATNLSIEEAIKKALLSNEDVLISSKNLEKSEYKFIEARSSALPQISGEATWMKYAKAPKTKMDLGPLGTMEFKSTPDYENKVGLSAFQPIFTFGKITNAVFLANDYVKAQGKNLEATKLDTEALTKELYFTALFARISLDIIKKSYDNAKRNEKALKERFGTGRISRYDNIKMAADVASRIPAVMEGESNYFLATKRLKVFLGMEDSEEITLTSVFKTNFDELKVTKLEEEMLNNEPKLKELKQYIGISDKAVHISGSDFLPSIGAFLNYQYGGGGKDKIVEKKDMGTTLIYGLKATMTLWDSGATYGRYKQAVSDRSIAEISFAKAVKNYKLAMETAVSEYNSTRETYKANQTAFKLAKESYNISLSSFSSGYLTQSQLNDAELMLTQATLQTEGTLYKINILLSKIDRLRATRGF